MRQIMAPRFLTELGDILAPLLTVVAVVAIVLKMLDIAPSQLERLRATVAERDVAARTLRFDSVQDAEEKLKMEALVPVYFPDYLIWPPAAVYAQRDSQRDSMVLTMIFWSIDLREGLLVRQGPASGDEPRSWFAEPFVVQSRSIVSLDVNLNGEVDVEVHGLLIEGKDSDGGARNQLTWRLEGRDISLVTPYSVGELVRMGESVHFRRGDR